MGVPVKRIRGEYVPKAKANAKAVAVRKAGCRDGGVVTRRALPSAPAAAFVGNINHLLSEQMAPGSSIKSHGAKKHSNAAPEQPRTPLRRLTQG